MVRRAERGVGKAIRHGQETGTVAKQGDIGGVGSGGEAATAARKSAQHDLARPSDFASPAELNGDAAGIYALTDNVSNEQSEEAIAEAKVEESLSRANVARKANHEARPTGDRATRKSRLPWIGAPPLEPEPSVTSDSGLGQLGFLPVVAER